MHKAALFAAVVLAGVASAATVTNTFDVPAGPISADGVTALGVTFQFSGGTATYGNVIGTDAFGLAPLSDPVLDGPAGGILTLAFLQAVSSLSFDFVLGPVAGVVSPGVTVDLSGPDFVGSSPQTAPTGAPNLFMLALGAFSYSGSPFTQAVITFSSDAQVFAIDNLVYDQVELNGNLPGHAPEPGTVALVGCAVLLVALRRKYAH